MKRRKVATLGLLFTVLLGLTTGCSKSEEKTETAKSKDIVVHYGYQPGHSQIVVAQAKGWLDEEFSKDGITIQLDKFASGPPMIEAFTAGGVQIGQVGDQPSLQAQANGAKVKAIGVYDVSSKTNQLLATKESGVNSIADLKGKKVGVTIGSVGHQLLYILLDSAGLKPSDIQILNLQPADIKSSLASKNIDAAVTWDPIATQIIDDGIAKLITDGEKYKLGVNVIIANSDFLKEHGDIAERLLKVLDKSQKWIDENKDEALQIVSKDSGFSVDVLKPKFDKTNRNIRFSDEAVKSVKETAKYLYDNKIIKKEVNVDELIDKTYLNNAGVK
ncbi:MAG: ABC transporter substrate-binding protein [Clostridiaceae bacterium]